MIKNKKGFTLVELLSVIVLIGLLLGIGIPGVNRISQNMKNKSLNTKIDLIEQAGILWGQDNKTLLRANDDCKDKDGNNVSCYKISIENLIEDDYLESEDHNTISYKNPVDDSELISKCVYVYKKNNRVYSHFSTSNNCDGSVAGGGGNSGGGVPPINKPDIVATDDKSSGEWHNADFTLNFTASSGTEIYYGFDESSINTKASSFFVAEETLSKTIYVKACNGSTCSANSFYEIKLDKTAPIISFSANPLTIKLYDIVNLSTLANVSDTGSGVKNTTYEGSVNNNIIGTYNITYNSEDNVGHKSSLELKVNVVGETVFVTSYKSSNAPLQRCKYSGTSWSCEQVTSMNTGNTLGVSAVNENTVFVTSYKSSNAPLQRCKYNGTSWSCEQVTSMNTGNTLGVSAVNENTVFVTSYKSSNAPLQRCKYSGTSWSCEQVTSMNTGNTLGVSAVNENTVFVTSYKSSNAPLQRCKYSGTSWSCEQVTSMNTGNTLGVSAVNENNVFVSNSSNLNYCSKNGTSWSCEQVTSMSASNTLGISSVNENNVFVSNSSKLNYCSKNGTSWSCEQVTSMSSGEILWSSATSENIVFVSNYSSSSSKLNYCSKNGTSWSCEQVISMSSGNVLGVSAVGSLPSGYALKVPD